MAASLVRYEQMIPLPVLAMALLARQVGVHDSHDDYEIKECMVVASSLPHYWNRNLNPYAVSRQSIMAMDICAKVWRKPHVPYEAFWCQSSLNASHHIM